MVKTSSDPLSLVYIYHVKPRFVLCVSSIPQLITNTKHPFRKMFTWLSIFIDKKLHSSLIEPRVHGICYICIRYSSQHVPMLFDQLRGRTFE